MRNYGFSHNDKYVILETRYIYTFDALLQWLEELRFTGSQLLLAWGLLYACLSDNSLDTGVFAQPNSFPAQTSQEEVLVMSNTTYNSGTPPSSCRTSHESWRSLFCIFVCVFFLC